jgi:trigger factor
MRSVKIDGFRKGKVPLHLVEARYGEYADQEVAENLLKSAFLDAVTEKQLTPIAEPRYDFSGIRRGEPFSFKAVFDSPPTFELGKYREIAVDERVCVVENSDIDREVDSLRDQHAVVTKKEGDGAQIVKGDLAKIRMKRIDDVDSEIVKDLEYKEYPIVVGRVKQDSVLDDQLVGMKLNEEKAIEVKYPKDYYIKRPGGPEGALHGHGRGNQ